MNLLLMFVLRDVVQPASMSATLHGLLNALYGTIKKLKIQQKLLEAHAIPACTSTPLIYLLRGVQCNRDCIIVTDKCAGLLAEHHPIAEAWVFWKVGTNAAVVLVPVDRHKRSAPGAKRAYCRD